MLVMKPEILLKAYVVHQSEDAFRELVAVSLDRVYSTALRIAQGVSYLAEETALRVYWKLARKAPGFGDDIVLESWLHKYTCKTAVSILRKEGRSIDRLVLKNELHAVSTQDSVEPAPRGLATRVCQGVLLNAAWRKHSRWRFMPAWPAWIRPWHVRVCAICAIFVVVVLNVPFHRRHPIILAPDVRLTPASFAQLGTPDEDRPVAPSVQAETNPSQR
jgi:hypothetical protein